MAQTHMAQTVYPFQPANQFIPNPPPPNIRQMGIAPLNPSIVQKLRDKLDVDGDGGVDLNDAMAALDKLTEPKYKCSECGKGLKKKSKYGTELCVECYRNPSDEARCISSVTSGARCKRRKSSDSEKGYCGIHMRKHAEPLPLTD
tara:strand:+ start:1535 stop:1969 length:435 start_codon:yes stop_codon:yes gene_type:complete